MADLLKFSPGIRAQRILVKYLAKVPNVVKANLVQFSNQLLTEGLVPEGVYDPQNRLFSSLESATALYKACMTTVKNDPSKFFTLMEILTEYPTLDGDVQEMTARAVQAELMDQRSEFMPQEDSHGGIRQRQRGLVQPASGTILGIRDMRAVMEELQRFAEWRELGRNLGVDEGQLNVFESDAGRTYSRLSKVIEHWLKRNHNEEECGPPTWGNLAKAMKLIDKALAMEIEKKRGIYSGTANQQPATRQFRQLPPITGIPNEQMHETDRQPVQQPPTGLQLVPSSPKQSVVEDIDSGSTPDLPVDAQRRQLQNQAKTAGSRVRAEINLWIMKLIGTVEDISSLITDYRYWKPCVLFLIICCIYGLITILSSVVMSFLK